MLYLPRDIYIFDPFFEREKYPQRYTQDSRKYLFVRFPDWAVSPSLSSKCGRGMLERGVEERNDPGLFNTAVVCSIGHGAAFSHALSSSFMLPSAPVPYQTLHCTPAVFRSPENGIHAWFLDKRELRSSGNAVRPLAEAGSS